jgi:hypothetical protein
MSALGVVAVVTGVAHLIDKVALGGSREGTVTILGTFDAGTLDVAHMLRAEGSAGSVIRGSAGFALVVNALREFGILFAVEIGDTFVAFVVKRIADSTVTVTVTVTATIARIADSTIASPAFRTFIVVDTFNAFQVPANAVGLLGKRADGAASTINTII